MTDAQAQTPVSARECVAEALGTLFLVFAGTLAIVVNGWRNGAVTHVGIALTFGLAVILDACQESG